MQKVFPQSVGFWNLNVGQIFPVAVSGFPLSMRSFVVKHQEERFVVVSIVQPVDGEVGDQVGVVALGPLRSSGRSRAVVNSVGRRDKETESNGLRTWNLRSARSQTEAEIPSSISFRIASNNCRCRRPLQAQAGPANYRYRLEFPSAFHSVRFRRQPAQAGQERCCPQYKKCSSCQIQNTYPEIPHQVSIGSSS